MARKVKPLKPTKKDPNRKVTQRTRNKQEYKEALGRPGEYAKIYNKKAFQLMLLGLTEEELAAFFEVSINTLWEWKRDYPAFAEAIKAGKEDADIPVVESLRKSAMGYDYKGKHYPASQTAQIFWLSNRHRQKWKRGVSTDDELPPTPPTVTINNQTIDTSKLSDASIKELLRAINTADPKG